MNKNKKIVAFAMFETNNITSVLPTLNKFLKKRLIRYYTVQLNTLENMKQIILLNFEEIKKDLIIKVFNQVMQDLVENIGTITFFKNSNLERKFLEPILKKSSSKVSLIKQNKSIVFSNGNSSFFLNIYSVNLDYLDDLDSFISNFLKIVSNFNRSGYLTFNFRIDNNDQIIFSPLFSETCKMDEEFNTENSINTFFNYGILKMQDIKINQVFSYLWRIAIFNDFLSLKDFAKLFIEKDQNSLVRLLAFNEGFEDNLSRNQLEFIRLGKNLLLIEDKFLFVSLIELESEYIHRIIEKYHSRYYILITILNEKGLKKLVEIPEFKSLQHLRLLSQQEIINFNFEVFKNKG
ncbi:MAG: hypothetical protein ACFFA3_16090 [Promethearchaeota archaeon]